MIHFVEIRAYTLKPGTREQFHQLMLEKSMPMLKRWNMDVVAFGRSPQDEDSYYLIRGYESLAHHEQSQDAFYGSDEWRQGSREAIIALIVNSTSIILELDDATVHGLRR